jgi:hypothetical protein
MRTWTTAVIALAFAGACATNDTPDDPAAQFGDGKADGAAPPRKAWLPLEHGETLTLPFSDDAGAPTEMIYAELALSGPATVAFDANDTTLYVYGDGWAHRLAKHRDRLVADLDAGTYRLLLLRRHATPSVELSTWCAGDGCTVYTAFPIDAPQIVNVKGGLIQTSPRFVAVTFEGEPMRDDLEQFLAEVPGSDYWAQTTAEYGIGDATVGAPVHLTETPPTSLTQAETQAWVAAHLDGTHPEWGTPDAHAFYVVYFPASTQLDLNGAKGCTGFGGYHDSTQLADGTRIVYAAIPRCATFNGLQGVDAVTVTTSHELVEGVTDPYSSQYAYALPDDNHFAWSIETGGEAGDMCAAVPGANTHVPGLSYMVQRTWSNAAARAGADPCVPHVAAAPYVVAAPVLDHIKVSGNATLGVQVPVGESRTIEVDLSTDGPASQPWTVKAVDGAVLLGGTPNLDFSWDRTTGDNGDRLHLTIKALKADPRGFSTFIIGAQTDPANASLWHGFVTN